MAAKRIRMHQITSKEVLEGNLKAVMRLILGMVSHRMSIITIFGHKLNKTFIQKNYIIITLLHSETSEKSLLQTTRTFEGAVGNGPTADWLVICRRIWTNQKKSRDHKIKKLNGAF